MSDIQREIAERRRLEGLAKLILPEPKCPECRTGVDRPKCFFDLPPDVCPRHEIRREWRKKLDAIVERIRDDESRRERQREGE